MSSGTWLLAAIALAGIAAVLVPVLAVLRDPHRLMRAEFVRERIAAGFGLRQATIDGRRWCYVERAAAAG